LVDNYDSFTYNLKHYLESFDADVDVIRNDEIDLTKVDAYDKIVLSPGPGLPINAGKQNELIKKFASHKPILGVCLGFQALVEFFGGSIYNQEIVKHGVAENCKFDIQSKLFSNLPSTFKVGLYHSWAANKTNFPVDLKITASLTNAVVMAFEHVSLPIAGVQFHPESILTENGKKIIENFLGRF